MKEQSDFRSEAMTEETESLKAAREEVAAHIWQEINKGIDEGKYDKLEFVDELGNILAYVPLEWGPLEGSARHVTNFPCKPTVLQEGYLEKLTVGRESGIVSVDSHPWEMDLRQGQFISEDPGYIEDIVMLSYSFHIPRIL